VVEAGPGEAGAGRGNEGAFVQLGTEVGRVSLVAVKHEPVPGAWCLDAEFAAGSGWLQDRPTTIRRLVSEPESQPCFCRGLIGSR
jgi:hypothetical protein